MRLFTLLIVAAMWPAGLAYAESVKFVQANARGIPVNMIYVNLNDLGVQITAAIAQGGIGGSESFDSFMQRLQPTAAINGTFFSKRDWRPIGDIVIDGQLVHFGGMGTGLCVAEGNRVSFASIEWGRHMDWSGYKTVVCCGPRLVKEGRIVLNARGEGFRDPHVLGVGRRTAVGVTCLNRLLLLNTRKACTLAQLADIMQDLDCNDAINLDGGTSVAMYFRGRAISTPGRRLTNVLLVYQRADLCRGETALRF